VIMGLDAVWSGINRPRQTNNVYSEILRDFVVNCNCHLSKGLMQARPAEH